MVCGHSFFFKFAGRSDRASLPVGVRCHKIRIHIFFTSSTCPSTCRDARSERPGNFVNTQSATGFFNFAGCSVFTHRLLPFPRQIVTLPVLDKNHIFMPRCPRCRPRVALRFFLCRRSACGILRHALRLFALRFATYWGVKCGKLLTPSYPCSSAPMCGRFNKVYYLQTKHLKIDVFLPLKTLIYYIFNL